MLSYWGPKLTPSKTTWDIGRANCVPSSSILRFNKRKTSFWQITLIFSSKTSTLRRIVSSKSFLLIEFYREFADLWQIIALNLIILLKSLELRLDFNSDFLKKNFQSNNWNKFRPYIKCLKSQSHSILNWFIIGLSER